MSVRIINADVREGLRRLPANSVHCVVTSPPCWGLRSYLPAGHDDKHREIGLEAAPEAWIATLVEVFREVRRVLRNNGTLWLNVGDSYAGSATIGRNDAERLSVGLAGGHGGGQTAPNMGAHKQRMVCGKPKDLMLLPARLALALQADGWWLRSDCIWAKPNPMPESVTDRPTSAHEHVFLFAKRPTYFWDAGAVREEELNPGASARQIAYQQRMRIGNEYRKGEQVSDSIGSWKGGEGAGQYSWGRNMRNVWTLATEAYPAAHFATFPTELAARCIRAGSSERGCCSQCGKPWVRQVERTAMVIDRSARTHPMGRTRTSGTMLEPPTSITTGWSASCNCNAGVVPCTVADIFMGSGTTCLVAERLQRDSIGIELSAEYCEMARRRIADDAPMLTEVMLAEPRPLAAPQLALQL